MTKTTALIVEEITLDSVFLERDVTISIFLPEDYKSVLLINDGQNMKELGLAPMLEQLIGDGEIEPLCCIAIHAGPERKAEYGTALYPDYMGRGAKAAAYTRFIFQECLPSVSSQFQIDLSQPLSFAGFSLGGLSALDIAWNHPNLFSKVGVFSGSLWWRSRGLDDGYVEASDRIMHKQIREGSFYPWLKFFFETGVLDEKMDRNNNGIIDSIDDTLGLIDELVAKGYDPKRDITYLELKDGKHDITTWARAMPVFLKWGWAK